jgi:hypothetical protein
MNFLRNLKSHMRGLPLAPALALAVAAIGFSAVHYAHTESAGQGDGALSLVGVKADGATLHASPSAALPEDGSATHGYSAAAPGRTEDGVVSWKLLIGFLATGALLTAPFDAPMRAGEWVYYPVAQNVQLYPGGIIALDAAGYATPATDAPNLWVVGRCDEYGPSTEGLYNGGAFVKVRRGIFAYTNSTADPCSQSDVGNVVFIESDSVINKSGGVNKVPAGRLIEIDPQTGALWVDFNDKGLLAA